jgi:hypothetical protein
LHAVVSAGGNVLRATAGVVVGTIGTGEFCVHFPAGVVTGNEVATVAPEYSTSPEVDISAQWASDGGACASGTEAVRTFAGSTSAAEGFTISVS